MMIMQTCGQLLVTLFKQKNGALKWLCYLQSTKTHSCIVRNYELYECTDSSALLS